MRLLRLAAVEAKASIRKSEIYEQIRQGDFPRPVHPSPKSSAWVESEVDEWIARRIAEREERLARKNQGRLKATPESTAPLRARPVQQW
jgi:prophage regulatory protein